MNITVLIGSPRRGGNTEIMTQAFIDGALETGADVSTFRLSELNILPCSNCDYCKSHTDTCIKKDDMTDILRSIAECQTVVFATPVYWWGMTAYMKLALDRLYALSSDTLRGKRAVLLANAYDDGEVFDPLLRQFKMIADYLSWQTDTVTIGGMTQKGAMHSSYVLKKVKEIGKS